LGYRPPRSGRAFLQAVLIGACSGPTLMLIPAFWHRGIVLSEAWRMLLVIPMIGLIAVPFVAIGLALFGLPLTWLLRKQAQKRWVGALAAGWSAFSGMLLFYAIDRLLLDFGQPGDVRFGSVGAIFGLPTGLAWWLLERRELAAQQE